ncbi:MAG: hypothetical protein FD168_2256 [Desulfobulbaceae bacterium]|nr:MAG: hypothetical protein FD168_2256 [Desulfobulbaceae bacterium]
MDEKDKSDMIKKLRKGVKLSPMIHSSIMSGFDQIIDFIDFVKSALKREQDITSMRLEEGTHGLNEEELESYYEFYGEDYLKIDEVFRKAAIELIIVKIYSHIEVGMCDLCDVIRQDRQKHDNETIEPRDSVYLDSTKKYMIKNLGLNLELDKNLEWAEILGHKDLRNAIVHNDGWLSTKNGTIKKLIENGLVEVGQKVESDNQISGKISLKFEYIDYILPKVRKFFQDLKPIIK